MAKKRAVPRSNRRPRRAAAVGASLTSSASLLDGFEQTSGIINYPTAQTATLRERSGALSLLVMDVPPLGLFSVADVAAAASHFRDLLNVPGGAVITVAGERGVLNGQRIFKIVRALDNNLRFGGRP